MGGVGEVVLPGVEEGEFGFVEGGQGEDLEGLEAGLL